MTGAHTNTNLGRQRADTERDRQVQGRQAGSDVCCRPSSIVSTPLKHRLTGLQRIYSETGGLTKDTDTLIDGLKQRQTGCSPTTVDAVPL